MGDCNRHPAGWTAIVLAGERPGNDPMGRPFGPGPKALVEVGGRPMVSRVCETLLACSAIARVVVLAQDEAALASAFPDGCVVRPSGMGIASSVAAVAGGNDAPWPVLVTTADHPLLTPATVAEFLDGVGGADVAVGFVDRSRVLARHPTTRRTWLRMSDGGWTGANLFALTGPAARPALGHWAAVERDRKRAAALIASFGLWLAVSTLTRRLTLAQAIGRAGERLGLRAAAVALSDPDMAVDVDRPADRRLAELILWAREDAR